MNKVVKWEEIAENYSEALLLGNGASIAIDARFSYPSLHEAAKSFTHITKDVQDVFDIFKTSDFELVLRELWHANMVNTALGVSVKEVEEAYTNIRYSLIKTVRDVHIDHAGVNHLFGNMYKYMQRFRTVISLNYDVLVYWAMLQGNEDLKCNWFKDAFIEDGGTTLSTDIDYLWKPYRAAKGATLIFYPHGNLVIADKIFTGEEKIQAGFFSDLLDEIFDRWMSGNYTPVFVSEGDPTKKRIAIDSSNYLSRVYYEILPKIGETLTIYGWGIGIQDGHILSQVSKNKFKNVAVSVVVDGKLPKEIDDYCNYTTSRLNSVGITNIEFFDAASPGCWIHA